VTSSPPGASPSEIPRPDEKALDAPWANKDAAVDEERNWPSLSDVKEANDRIWLRFYGFIVIAIAVTFTFIFLSSLVVWAVHYILPKHCLWLDADQLSKIQSVLFSGGMGAVITSVIKRQMDRLEAGERDS
jgi:hypothetical protein